MNRLQTQKRLVQVATAPDGRTYVYQAGWSEFHITDVTDPRNITQVGKYYDKYQVLDVKYLEYDGREYVITQNQLIDPGYAIQTPENGPIRSKFLLI